MCACHYNCCQKRHRLSFEWTHFTDFFTLNVNNVSKQPAFSKLETHEKISPDLKPIITDVPVPVHVHIYQDGLSNPQDEFHLQQQDIIEPARGSSLWASPIVAFPKPNSPNNYASKISTKPVVLRLPKKHAPRTC